MKKEIGYKLEGAKMMSEQSFVNKLYEAYKGKDNFTFYSYNVRNKNESDVSFKCTLNDKEYFFILEAKKYNIFNKANYPKQILSEILINRNNYSKYKAKFENGYQPVYGFLIPCELDKNEQVIPDKIYIFLKKHFSNTDWNDFGKTFNCEYVFLFDEKSDSKKLYYCEWRDFLIKDNWKLQFIE